jgi:hypothetical protein
LIETREATGLHHLRLLELEGKFQKSEKRISPESATKPWRDTFGMFADDADFDEVLRLGREYRAQEDGPGK